MHYVLTHRLKSFSFSQILRFALWHKNWLIHEVGEKGLCIDRCMWGIMYVYLQMCNCVMQMCECWWNVHVCVDEDANISANLSCDCAKHSVIMWVFPKVCKQVCASVYVIIQRRMKVCNSVRESACLFCHVGCRSLL